jgi:hypothetical protein
MPLAQLELQPLFSSMASWGATNIISIALRHPAPTIQLAQA